MTNDCVWYWVGGRETGEWRRATLAPSWATVVGGEPPAATLAALAAEIERGGRVAVLGSIAIGEPEGPPSVERFRAVGASFSDAVERARCEACGCSLTDRDRRAYESEGGSGYPSVCKHCAEDC